MDCIEYNDGYKYQLKRDYIINISIKAHDIPDKDFIVLKPDGTLIIKKGYAWDGPSGPAIDTKTFMRGSLVHDALYQLMRESLLSKEYKSVADQLLHDICVKDGMWSIRAWWVLKGVAWFGDPNIDPANKRPPITAP